MVKLPLDGTAGTPGGSAGLLSHYSQEFAKRLANKEVMSTLMSVDMNIERSSTRLHAPPGGKTSICFGDYDTSVDYPTKKTIATTRKHHTAAKSSMSDLLSPRNEEEDEENVVKQVMKPSNSSQMAGIFATENETPKAAVRVRQAPGGRSSLVLG